MSSIKDYSSHVELAWAAYANLQVGSLTRAQLGSAEIPDAFADALSTRYTVEAIHNDPFTGAYAVVFKDIATGSKTLAIRGTEGAGDVIADTHFMVGIPAWMSLQYQSLVEKIEQWQVGGVINAQTTLTGHSLGGYLAAAVKSYYPNSFGATYTYNAPGLGSALGSIAEFFQSAFGLAPNLADVYDLRGTTGLSFIAGLGMHMGTPVPVEIESAPGLGLGNHSIGRINQPLAVLNLLATLDPTLTLERGNALTLAASTRSEDTVEKLLHAIDSLFTPNSNVTATGNDQDLYARISVLQANPLFASLAGKVTLNTNVSNMATQAKARVGFEEIVALETLAPFVLNAAGAEGQSALEALWISAAWAERYNGWLSDKASLQTQGTPASYTDSWITDRALLLQSVLTRNTNDSGTTVANSALPTDRVVDMRYVEPGSTTSTTLTLWNPANNPLNNALTTRAHQLIAFGGDAADSLGGTAETQFGDRLYGADGADTIRLGIASSAAKRSANPEFVAISDRLTLDLTRFERDFCQTRPCSAQSRRRDRKRTHQVCHRGAELARVREST